MKPVVLSSPKQDGRREYVSAMQTGAGRLIVTDAKFAQEQQAKLSKRTPSELKGLNTILSRHGLQPLGA
ncbi:MAG: hypothetical protein WCK05_12095 [Planctomycetota bacterium]